MFNIDDIKIKDIDVFLLKLENYYLITFRSNVKELYHTCIKIKYGPNERPFNHVEIKVISELLNKRVKFNNIEFNNIIEVMKYLESIT